MAKYSMCEICEVNLGDKSAIIDNVYYKNVCNTCHNSKNIVSSGHAQWQRNLDVEDREADIQQPWNSDGTINTRFAKLYPRQAKALFSDEELNKATRS